MRLSVATLARTLQTLLTRTADAAARDAGFVRRRRKLGGADFVQALVLGWLEDPKARLDDLAALLGVSEQALQKRLTPRATDCLLRVLKAALMQLVGSRPETIPLLRRFPAVHIDDSTSLRLPAALAGVFPGCGGAAGAAGRAGMKLMARLEALTGGLTLLPPAPGRASDRTLRDQLPAGPAGSLRLADLGFFDLRRLAADTARGIHWISRVPARLSIRTGPGPARPLADWLAAQRTDRIDAVVTLGVKDRLDCRLVAVRVPAAVAAVRLKRRRRRLKKKGRTLSERQRVLCEWFVLITDLDAARFSIAELEVLYRVRWQIELVFKRWKSLGGLAASRGRTASRVLCEVLAKLLGVLVAHWAVLLRGGPLSALSPTRATRRVQHWAGRLLVALQGEDAAALERVLEQLQSALNRLPKRPRRRRPSTRQLLFAPRSAA